MSGSLPLLSVEVAPRRLRLRRVGIAAALLVAATALAWGVTFTPLFGAKVVRVEGTKRLGTRQVMRLAEISPGTNVFHLDISAAEARLKQSPWVAGAAITVQLPSTVVIGVTERTAVALVLSSGDSARLVAADGVVVGAGTGREQMPTISGANVGAKGGAGVGVSPDAAVIREGALAAGSMAASLRSQISSIQVGSDGSILALLRTGVAVSYGGPTDLQSKNQALEAVLVWAQQQGKRLVAIDLTVPVAPTATLAGGAVTAPR